jgi:hypothetical protein
MILYRQVAQYTWTAYKILCSLWIYTCIVVILKKEVGVSSLPETQPLPRARFCA